MGTKFYANASVTSFGDALVRDVRVSFSSKLVNEIYGFPKVNNQVYKYKIKVRENQWFPDKLHDGVTSIG